MVEWMVVLQLRILQVDPDTLRRSTRHQGTCVAMALLSVVAAFWMGNICVPPNSRNDESKPRASINAAKVPRAFASTDIPVRAAASVIFHDSFTCILPGNRKYDERCLRSIYRVLYWANRSSQLSLLTTSHPSRSTLNDFKWSRAVVTNDPD